MPRTGPLWRLFKGFHPGRVLVDDEGRKGYVVAPRIQDVESLHAPTYWVQWRGDKLAVPLSGEQTLAWMRKKFVELYWVPSVILAAQKAKWKEPSPRIIRWADALTANKGGARHRREAEEAKVARAKVKADHRAVRAQAKLERRAKRAARMAGGLPPAEQTIVEKKRKLAVAVDAARPTAVPKEKAPVPKKAKTAAQPSAPGANVVPASAALVVQTDKEAVLQSVPEGAGPQEERALAAEQDAGGPSESWVNSWTDSMPNAGKQYLASVCFKPGDVRIVDIKAEDQSGDFEVDYIVDQVGSGRKAQYLVKWKGYELNLGNGGAVKGDWESLANVTGTAALREWKKKQAGS